MKRGLFKLFLINVLVTLIWLVLFPLSATAQSYNIKTYRYQDGVISNVVFNAVQDLYGNIWFATRNGVTVFDGVVWRDACKEYQNCPEGEGLVSRDENGVIWWASLRAPLRITRLVDDRWVDIPEYEVDPREWQLVGFRTFSNEQGQTVAALVTSRGLLIVWDGDHWSTVSEASSARLVFSMELDETRILLSTGEGLLTVDRELQGELAVQKTGLPKGPVFAVAPNLKTGISWVVGPEWVARMKGGQLEELFPLPGLILNHPFSVSSACQNPEGGFYYVDSSHVFVFIPGIGVEHLSLASGLATDDGLCVMADREKNIWITSVHGISKIISRRLACFSHRQGLYKNEVSAVLERASGEMVIGHLGGLTFCGTQRTTVSFGALPGVFSRVMDLAEDEDEVLWIAARRRGVGQLLDNGDIRWYGASEGLPFPVYGVLPLANHELFVGTSAGVFRKTGSVFKKIDLPGISDNSMPYGRRLVPLKSGGSLLRQKPTEFLLGLMELLPVLIIVKLLVFPKRTRPLNSLMVDCGLVLNMACV